MIRSRLAPTPSGYLHLGNALNFLLTWLLVRRQGGVLRLRIDDADASRSRPEFVADIFRQLEWLGLTWDEGPSGPDDFAARYSQLQRLELYRSLLARLADSGQLFFCTCSRRQINQATPDGLYPGTCRGRRDLPAAPHAIRIQVPPEWSVSLPLAATPPHPATPMGDFILWRRDDLPAYQLASLADDLADRINLVVRGRDLLASSAAQLFLASRLGGDGQDFWRAAFCHHPLIVAPGGRKLSKSDQDLSLAAMREHGVTPARIYREVAAFLGLDPAPIGSLEELQAAFNASPPALSCAGPAQEDRPDLQSRKA
ncbi:MAG TPA: tRNA glutamyl-Q synthetase [Desulfurivibrio alkaliphilus]|uniref:tRNA glutamyl-Q synthetase n=1 Tax=Desulfurivibrio alkaliphilus TaxID=427923 RepID=A0A7C2X9K9_9BACT|nr:tRNA glutamyl-Q synthetase [Desulfurivibrio alkaliphilus]